MVVILEAFKVHVGDGCQHLGLDLASEADSVDTVLEVLFIEGFPFLDFFGGSCSGVLGGSGKVGMTNRTAMGLAAGTGWRSMWAAYSAAGMIIPMWPRLWPFQGACLQLA